jgi:hypothetical protein
MQVEDDPDVGWVAALSGVTEEAAASAVREAAGDRGLYAYLDREHRREGRESYIEIDAPLELHAIARLIRPRHVVEVGVSSGVSSAYLLDALGQNGVGTLHSVDLPAHPRGPQGRRSRASWSLPPSRATGWAVPMALRGRWDLRLGDKSEVIPLLAAELPRIDLVVYDVPHDEVDLVREFSLLDPRMGRGAVAIVDHGPGGGLCLALRRWARGRASVPVRRSELGLFGMRCGRRTADWRPAPSPRPPGRSRGRRAGTGSLRIDAGEGPFPPSRPTPRSERK